MPSELLSLLGALIQVKDDRAVKSYHRPRFAQDFED